MTAAVILNIVFAVLVLVGMLSLLAAAILRDARARGARVAPFPGMLRLRLRVRFRPSGGPRRAASRYSLGPEPGRLLD